MDIQTTACIELIDITDRISKLVKDSGIIDGICVVSTRHTTCSIIPNFE